MLYVYIYIYMRVPVRAHVATHCSSVCVPVRACGPPSNWWSTGCRRRRLRVTAHACTSFRSATLAKRVWNSRRTAQRVHLHVSHVDVVHLRASTNTCACTLGRVPRKHSPSRPPIGMS